MDFINQIYELIECQNDIETQNEGLRLAQGVSEIDVFIMPMFALYNKNIWENCAKIIVERSDDEISKYLPNLLEWLQDLNWPGALLILNRLNSYNKNDLLVQYIYAVSTAKTHHKDEQEWLYNLTGLLKNKILVQGLDKKMYNELSELYDEFWL